MANAKLCSVDSGINDKAGIGECVVELYMKEI